MEESYGVVKNLSPSNDVSLHFATEPRPSVTIHFSLLELWKLLKTIEK